ncbi:hypothetical protein [uncultured Propionivibrio sp.]|uniref:hypothetical protein n=1 Tax=uncultured Propionivibrio sp. TaxID=426737 RepID=UPI0029C09FF0|nr:hypothetical protein [uncultured Propionivibrio sp.]
MFFSRRLRYLISMMLTLCLVGMSALSYGGESENTIEHGDKDSLQIIQSFCDLPDACDLDKTCSHGCHAQSHFAGAGLDVGPLFRATPLDVKFIGNALLARMPSPPREGPYRPPQQAFQA